MYISIHSSDSPRCSPTPTPIGHMKVPPGRTGWVGAGLHVKNVPRYTPIIKLKLRGVRGLEMKGWNQDTHQWEFHDVSCAYTITVSLYSIGLDFCWLNMVWIWYDIKELLKGSAICRRFLAFFGYSCWEVLGFCQPLRLVSTCFLPDS